MNSDLTSILVIGLFGGGAIVFVLYKAFSHLWSGGRQKGSTQTQISELQDQVDSLEDLDDKYVRQSTFNNTIPDIRDEIEEQKDEICQIKEQQRDNSIVLARIDERVNRLLNGRGDGKD